MRKKIQKHAEKFVKSLIKGLLKMTLVFVSLWLFVELSLRFFGTPLLSGALQSYIAIQSNGMYSADFEHISIELISRKIQIKKFSLTPDTAVYKYRVKDGQIQTGLYNIKFEKLTLKGIKFLKYLRKRELNLKSLVITRPTISLAALPKNNKTSKKKYDAVHQDLYASIKPFFDVVKVKQIKVNDGVFDFSISTESKQTKTNVEKVSLVLKQFVLDENSFRYNRKLFYSETYSLRIRNYRLALNDQIHEIRAHDVRISSVDSVILISGVSFKPISENLSNAKQPSRYDIEVPNIFVRGVDMFSAWFSKDIFVKDITIDSASISLIIPAGQKKSPKKRVSPTDYRDIYNLIQGKINSLSIQNFNFKNANFHMKESKNETRASYSISDFSMSLDHFILDSLSYLRKKKIFYSDNIALDVSGFQMKIADKTHLLKTEKFTLSSAKNSITAQNTEISSFKSDGQLTKIMMTIPKFSVEGVDFIKVYNTGKLEIAQVKVENADAKIEKSTKKNKNNHSASLIYDLVSNYVNSVEIEKIFFRNGRIDFTDYSIFEKPSYYKGNLTLTLNQFKIDESTAKNSDRLFYAHDFELMVSDYSMKSSNDFHSLQVGKLVLSSKKSEVTVENINFSPITNDIHTDLLMNYHKNAVISLSVDKLTLLQSDIKNILFNKQFVGNQIIIKKPKIQIVKYPYNFEDKSTNNQLLPYDLYGDSLKISTLSPDIPVDTVENENYKNIIIRLLKGKLDYINVNTILLDSGFLSFSRVDSFGAKISSFNTKISAKSNHFFLKTDSSQINPKFLFSDNIHVEISDFSTVMQGNKSTFTLKKAVYNSSDSALNASFVKIIPISTPSDSLNSGKAVSVLIPQIFIKGINFEKFLSDKKLEIKSLSADKPIVNVVFGGEKNGLSQQDSMQKTPTKKQNFGFKSLSINKIDITKGRLKLKHASDQKPVVFSQTGFNVHSENLFIYTQKTENELPFTSDKTLLRFTNFTFPLPDSIYRIEADTIDVSLQDEQIAAKNFKLRYDSLSIKNSKNLLPDKTMFFQISAPSLIANHLNFIEFIRTKTMNIKSIDFQDIQLDILKIAEPQNKKTLAQTQELIRQKITRKIKNLSIDTIRLNGSKISYKNLCDTSQHLARKFTISGIISDFDTDSLKSRQAQRMFLADDISLNLGNFQTLLMDSLYRAQLDTIRISTGNKTLSVESFNLNPTCNRVEFAMRNNNFQKGMMFLKTDRITAKNVDIPKLIETGGLKIGKIDVEGLNFRIFKDKQLPEDTTLRPKFPLDYLKLSKNLFTVDSINLIDANFYSEQNSIKSEKTGIVSIENINAGISNITNDTSLFETRKYIRLNMRGMLMGQAPLNVTFRFPLRNPQEYLYAGSMDTFDLKILNPILVNTTFISINQGTANTLNFSVKALPTHAEGVMNFYYSDLKMTIIDTTGTKKSFLSALAGAVLPSDNPTKGNNPKIKEGIISIDKLPYKPVYHLWTQSLITGAFSTLGLKNNQAKRSLKINKKMFKLMIDKQKKKNRMKAKNDQRLKREMEKELRLLEKQGRMQRRGKGERQGHMKK